MIFGWMFWEWKFAKFPMVPREMFRGQRVVGLVFFIAFVAGLNFYSMINFLPLTFGAVYSPDPIQVGLKGLGYGVSTTVGAVFFNALISSRIEAKWILLTGATLMTAFGGALIASNPHQSENHRRPLDHSMLRRRRYPRPRSHRGIDRGPRLPPRSPQQPSPSPYVLSAGSIGYTIYLNIFSKKLATKLPALVASYAITAGLAATDAEAFVTQFLTAPADITSAPGYTPAIAQAATMGSRWAYAESLKWVWVTSIPFGVLAIIACCLVPNIKQYQTNRIAAAI